MGRQRKDPRLLKHQMGLFISDEERYRLKHMAQTWGVTYSQMFGILINRAYEQGSYLQGYDELTQEERQELIYQREHVKSVTDIRVESAQQRNLERRNGLDRGLTNVMVVIAPEKQNFPGVFCHNLGQVWVIPYGILYKVKAVSLLPYHCFASVLDYFIGRRILPSHIASFIGKHRDYVLSSFGEKAVLTRLFAVYGSLNLSLQQSREIAQDTERAYERERVNRQLAKEYGYGMPMPNPTSQEVSSLLNQIKDSANTQIDEQLKQDEEAGIDTEIDTYKGPVDVSDLDDGDDLDGSDGDASSAGATTTASTGTAAAAATATTSTAATTTARVSGVFQGRKRAPVMFRQNAKAAFKGAIVGGTVVKGERVDADSTQNQAPAEPTNSTNEAMKAAATANMTQWGSTQEEDQSNFVIRNREREALGRWENGIFVPYENQQSPNAYKSPAALLGEDENNIPELSDVAPEVSSASEVNAVLGTMPLNRMDRFFNSKDHEGEDLSTLLSPRYREPSDFEASDWRQIMSNPVDSDISAPKDESASNMSNAPNASDSSATSDKQEAAVKDVKETEAPKKVEPIDPCDYKDPFEYEEPFADWLPRGNLANEIGIDVQDTANADDGSVVEAVAAVETVDDDDDAATTSNPDAVAEGVIEEGAKAHWFSDVPEKRMSSLVTARAGTIAKPRSSLALARRRIDSLHGKADPSAAAVTPREDATGGTPTMVGGFLQPDAINGAGLSATNTSLATKKEKKPRRKYKPRQPKDPDAVAAATKPKAKATKSTASQELTAKDSKKD